MTVVSDAKAADRDHVRRVFSLEVAAHRGRTIELGERRLAAAFDGPGRAVQCGGSVTIVAERSKIALRAGVHIGECDLEAPAGPLLDVCSQIAMAAAPGEVLVSRTIVDLVPGSGLEFTDRGTVRLQDKRKLAVLAVCRS